MSIEGVIREEASKIATRVQQSASRLEKEYSELQAKADEIKVKRDKARAAPDRLLNFQVKVGGDYSCPSCWIERNARSTLTPRPSPNGDDIFECAVCGHRTTITY
jgi:hypothetical protein